VAEMIWLSKDYLLARAASDTQGHAAGTSEKGVVFSRGSRERQ
jgi:hypothetical protein